MSSLDNQVKGRRQCVAPESRIGARSKDSGEAADASAAVLRKVRRKDVKNEHAEYPTSVRSAASSPSSSMVTVVPWSTPSAHAAFAPFLGAVFGLGLPLDFALAP